MADEKKTAKFVLNDPAAGPFSVRVAPDSGEVDDEGRPVKDGKVTIKADEPFEASEMKRTVRVNVRQPDGSYKEEDIERTIDVAARLRQYVGTRLSEVTDPNSRRAKAAAAKAEADEAARVSRKGR